MLRTQKLILSAILICLGSVTSSAWSQESKIYKVGVILLGGPGPSSDALRKGFARLGYIEGKNIALEFRYARGQMAKAPELAAELVSLKVDVIVAVGAVGLKAAFEATKTIPIVFSAVLSPVAFGYAASLERPGKNVTGITSFDPQQAHDQFALLKRADPNLARVAILSDQAIPKADGWNPLEKANDEAARASGLQHQWLRVRGPKPDLEGAFAEMANARAQALLVLEVPVTIIHNKPIAALAAKHRLPTMFPAGWPNEGLITYGTSILDATRRIPEYVDKILKGAKPGEMPIEVITKRRLIFNLKTARTIGFTVPPELLKQAERVIE